jgi:hydroxymethylglutaryl-CoA lyase
MSSFPSFAETAEFPFELPTRVTIVEVGPRDGLQNEAARVSADDKVAFIDQLSAAGAPVIEIGAWVRPDWVPQMADSNLVAQRIARRDGVRYTGLVPNLRGLEAARASGMTDVAIFAAASETFSRRNINRSIDESMTLYADVCREAIKHGMNVRGYVSTAFGCPFEGHVDPDAVAEVSRRLLDLGVYEVAVSDTIGIAHPGQVPFVLEAVLKYVPLHQVALHFHDTRGTALANVLASLTLGVTTFDASAGGLGGCPYAPGATGNLATEDLVYMLNGLKIETGIDLDAVLEASRFIESRVGHPLPSRYYRAEMSTRSRPTPAS